MKFGMHTISAADYHADPCEQPSLSASIAKLLLMQSPLHAWLSHSRLNPNFEREEDSRFDLGSAAHSMLLERSDAPIVWIDANDWRTNAAKAARDEARANGKLPILAKYQTSLKAMLGAANEAINNSELAGILDTGAPEQTLVWTEGDIWCRARLDLLSKEKAVILDYKSTQNAEPTAFIRQISRMGYDIQSEFYIRGLAMVANAKANFVFLAQEITPPYACSLISLSRAYQELARHKVNAAMKLWRECMSTGHWPSYAPHIHYAEPPTWEMSGIALQWNEPLEDFVP
jgi:PDDEXK-like domain of unknown function (DUF3799)